MHTKRYCEWARRCWYKMWRYASMPSIHISPIQYTHTTKINPLAFITSTKHEVITITIAIVRALIIQVHAQPANTTHKTLLFQCDYVHNKHAIISSTSKTTHSMQTNALCMLTNSTIRRILTQQHQRLVSNINAHQHLKQWQQAPLQIHGTYMGWECKKTNVVLLRVYQAFTERGRELVLLNC